jgi:pimeloyl-ACP methyl ester carboxylesterase
VTSAVTSTTGRWVLRVLFVLAVLTGATWTVAVGFLWANEPRLVFRAHVTRGIRYPIDSTPFSPVTFASPDGIALEGATITASAHAPPSRPGRAIPAGAREAEPYWILFCPGAGNSIHLRRVQTQLQQLAGMGYNIFAFDYRGFGRTGGVPTESGLYDDAMAAYRYVTTVRQVPASRVILAGRSLGSAVAVELATRVPSAGALLLSPIESVPATAALLYPWVPVYLLARNRFDSSGKIGNIRVPVVIVHATNDRLVPLDGARRLFSRVKSPKLMIETAGGHNRAGFSPSTELSEALSRFWPIALESTASELAAAGSS